MLLPLEAMDWTIGALQKIQGVFVIARQIGAHPSQSDIRIRSVPVGAGDHGMILRADKKHRHVFISYWIRSIDDLSIHTIIQIK